MQPAGRRPVGDRLRSTGRTVIRSAAMATADLRPLPDLVVIGVKRGGTTSLFRDLERHPAMCPLVPSARRLPMMRENMKGVHHFDGDMSRSMRWYRSHFASSLSRSWRERQVGASFTAEASPYYFFHPLAAGRAAAALPATTFLVMLRDPVERTVSHWAEQTRNGVETLPLRDALAAEAERLGDDRIRLTTGALLESHADEQQSYAAQSEYAASLARWTDAVGTDRVLVVFSEDYYRDPRSTLDTVTASIGVEPLPAHATSEHRNAAPRPGAIDADLDAELTERFRPDVERLVHQLGRRPPWPRFASTDRAGA
ncbi:MAG TPA: sulfotransferase [Ilumatobacteraceae bacterium]|nr:sulfotransferase [Ilumatobacteraceae bacterium]